MSTKTDLNQDAVYIQKIKYMNRHMTNLTKRPVRPPKTQISLGIRPVWSESSVCAQCIAKDSRLLQADSEDSN